MSGIGKQIVNDPELPLQRPTPTRLQSHLRWRLGVCQSCGIKRNVDEKSGLCRDCEPHELPIKVPP